MSGLPIPEHRVGISDGGAGIIGTTPDGFSAKIGVSSLGSAGTMYLFRGTDTKRVTDVLGTGPLPKAVIKNLVRSGGKDTLAYKSAAATAGVSSAITRSGGTTGPLVTLTGAPYDDAQVLLDIILGGVRGTATFRVSLDGGDTWSDTLLTAATYLLDSGVTVNFPNTGPYVAAERYAWTDIGPILSSGNISTAVDNITSSEYDVEFVHVVGHAATPADARTVATLLSSKVATAWGVKKFFWAAFDAPPDTDANLLAAFSSLADKGVVGFGGFAEVSMETAGAIEKIPQGWCISARIARNPVEIHPMRTITDENIDPLPDVVALLPQDAVSGDGYHDEGRVPGLNAARFCSLMSLPGVEGFYVAAAHTFAASNSNFKNLPHLRIILKVARVYYRWGLSQLARRVPKDLQTGYIRPSIADSIESDAEKVIKDALGGAIEGVRVLVNRADDLKNDPTLRSKIRVVVGEYILVMDSDIGISQTLPAAA